MQNLQIRKWQIEDIHHLKNLMQQFPTVIHDIEKALFSELYRGKVAISNGKIIGFVLYWILENEVEIHAVIVDKNYRGRSVGTALMTSVINELTSLQKPINIFLEVSENNIPALKLYKKLGFRQINIRKKYYRNEENALILMLEINPKEVKDV